MFHSSPKKPRLSQATRDRIEALLVLHEAGGFNRGLYPISTVRKLVDELEELAGWLHKHRAETEANKTNPAGFDEKTVLCISYVDHIDNPHEEFAAIALQKFFNNHLEGLYSHLHVLPHFPSPIIHEDVKGPASRADGGFEALDYKMDPKYGKPGDLKAIKAKLMFDFVLNHLSVKGELFEKFINDEPGYENIFLHLSDEEVATLDLSPVFRPREHNPIIPFEGKSGKKKNVWCTFSATQADLNINDPAVFRLIMEALVKDFIAEGAMWIRLDAVGYLVKMLGLRAREASTSCFGITETHNVLKVMRCFLNEAAPYVSLVPEVNATRDIIASYFGERDDEGHIVYDFPSGPISLYTIYREDASDMLSWAEARARQPNHIGLSFTSTHDGIGVLSMADLPNLEEGKTALEFFIHQVERRGGGINYKSKILDGEVMRIPYEACITWMQAILTPPEEASLKGNRLEAEEIDRVVDRYMASQSFIYAGPHCIPADYMGVVTSLLNDERLYEIAGHRRNKNRGLVDAPAFEKALSNPETSYEWLQHKVFARKKKMIQVRQTNPAFSPYGECVVDVIEWPDVHRPVYSVLRKEKGGWHVVLALTNCTPKTQRVKLTKEAAETLHLSRAIDMLAEDGHQPASVIQDDGTIILAPHQVAWLKKA